MANRFRDWFKQAEADLRHAQNSLGHDDFEWSCFAAQQAAEKALKAVFLRLGQEVWGHTLTALIGELRPSLEIDPVLIDYCRMLDKHYIPTRYPSGFDSGAPTDFYTSSEAQQAIAHAEKIIQFCRRQIDSPKSD